MQIQRSMKIKNFPFSNIVNKFDSFYQKYQVEIFRLLKEIVEINSYSYNIEGIERCFDLFISYVPSSLNVKKINHNLVISNSKERYIMLMGHMDTVFPKDLGFNSFLEREDKCYGPGVFDMKGGLIIALFSLIYLDYLKLLDKIPITFVINSDEEIGSINSKDLILNTSKNSLCAFVYEGAGDNNEIVVGRKGKIGLKITTHGQSQHAAFILKDKPSAILDMAHKIIEIEELNNEKEGISANVGKIEGGIGPNTVPEICTALVDIRFLKKEQEQICADQLKKILNKKHIKGVRCTYEITSSRPSMNPKNNENLYYIVKQMGKSIGLDIEKEIRAGVSDANFIAQNNIPVIDGMGPRGGRDHSTEEFIIKSSIKERILLSSLSILKSYELFYDNLINRH